MNRKTLEGSHNIPTGTRNSNISTRVAATQAAGQPVISIDTKKKELVGTFKNGGSDYRPEGCPEQVNVHDFDRQGAGQGHPLWRLRYRRQRWLRQCRYRSTTRLSSRSIRSAAGWNDGPRTLSGHDPVDDHGGWRRFEWVARALFKNRTSRAGSRNRPDDRGAITRRATSKWNKIEHRLFCHITQTWRGRPLTDRLAVVELIGATTTKTGLKVESALDTRSYQKGIKVSKAAMKCLDMTGDQFHPEWNYTIRPRLTTKS